ncbi:MAG: molybdenum cofactor biosynthesis protein [Planctomycetaceae bacterium]|nr:molybdenum cofactor biosynthesis protein [Planctomycetaceae bacterium]
MLSVSEAIAAICENIEAFAATDVALGDAQDLILAEAAISDVDSPPFDKALMDGFAVLADNVADGRATLDLIEEVTAGRVPTKRVESGTTIQIMTGAPMPDGADAVVKVEDSKIVGASVELNTSAVRPGDNCISKGTSMRLDEAVLECGTPLLPPQIALLAEIGKASVSVRRRPQIAVLATGDELVPIGETPGPGQIRNSNEAMLVAQIQRAGGEAVALGIARDEPEHLRECIERGLGCDMLLLSGGVSAGKLDLVPSVLAEANVGQIFHKVRVKPGKPLWFGVRSETDDSPRCHVFGLPGNPVSSMVCFELFVRTAIRRLMGDDPCEPRPIKARLDSPHQAKGDRPTYFPARIEWTPSGPTVSLVKWHGSSDLRSTAQANGMALVPAGDHQLAAGDSLEVFEW